MKKLMAIMVEHMGDSGDWVWFIVKRNTTPKQAIKDYFEEMGCDKRQSIKESKDENEKGCWYASQDNVRAYEIEIY